MYIYKCKKTCIKSVSLLKAKRGGGSTEESANYAFFYVLTKERYFRELSIIFHDPRPSFQRHFELKIVFYLQTMLRIYGGGGSELIGDMSPKISTFSRPSQRF